MPPLVTTYIVRNTTDYYVIIGELHVAFAPRQTLDLLAIPGLHISYIEKQELHGTLGYRLGTGELVREGDVYGGINSITIGGTIYTGDFIMSSGNGIVLNEDVSGTTVSTDLTGIAVTSIVSDGTTYVDDVVINSGSGINFTKSITGIEIGANSTIAELNITDVDVAEYYVDIDDNVLGVSYTEIDSVNIILPALTYDERGKGFIVKDEGGNASTHNINISVSGSGTIKIDGEDLYKITGDWDSVSAYFDGYNYMVY